jgi:hypothetical protein
MTTILGAETPLKSTTGAPPVDLVYCVKFEYDDDHCFIDPYYDEDLLPSEVCSRLDELISKHQNGEMPSWDLHEELGRMYQAAHASGEPWASELEDIFEQADHRTCECAPEAYEMACDYVDEILGKLGGDLGVLAHDTWADEFKFIVEVDHHTLSERARLNGVSGLHLQVDDVENPTRALYHAKSRGGESHWELSLVPEKRVKLWCNWVETSSDPQDDPISFIMVLDEETVLMLLNNVELDYDEEDPYVAMLFSLEELGWDTLAKEAKLLACHLMASWQGSLSDLLQTVKDANAKQ